MKPKEDFYVVGIGASAGGLDAVQQLFDNIPDKTGVAFIVIQHLSPNYKSLMPELLAKHTKMKIFTVKDKQPIKPNCIYLNHRNKNIGIIDNHFTLLDKAAKPHLNLPIDILFHMLGETFRERSIGIILSGTGTDGTRGIKTIKETGGTIFVQDPETAQFDGMPNSAISTSLADFILPPAKLAEKVVQVTSNQFYSIENEPKKVVKETLESVLTEVQKSTGVDFSKYKTSTLLRRLEKRMNLHNIYSLEDYIPFLKKEKTEKLAIKQEFLIGVTSFFRDKEVFEQLSKKVVSTILQKKSSKDEIRIWIAGCSSGEEVYSIAILFENYISNNKLDITYKIFATDINKDSLAKASVGVYPINQGEEIEPFFLDNYFFKVGSGIQIIKKIRDKIIFSYHNVFSDPPFINIDLVSCRNLLIYLSPSTQETVLSNFHFALKKGGFLVLGESESLSGFSHHFKEVAGKYRIFENMGGTRKFIPKVNNQFIKEVTNTGSIQPVSYNYGRYAESQKVNELFYYRFLSKKHAPVSVFIDKEYNVQFMQGDFRKWFSPADGMFSNILLDMVSAELAATIRLGMQKLIEFKQPVSAENLVSYIDEREIVTDLFFDTVSIPGQDENIYLVQFLVNTSDDKKKQIVLSDKEISNTSKQRIEFLEHKLNERELELQNIREELETSNEELQSSNEELMSSNEELQSSNEELQSVNEELYTINSEYQQKNKDLESLNNDINNLLDSTEIGTLFLDADLNIRKFTPAVKTVFNLENSDIGRSIYSFASEFNDEARSLIIANSKIAFEKEQSIEKEIQDSKGNWYLVRICPFLTLQKEIEGVVISFIDISNLKEIRRNLSESEERLSVALNAGNMAWWEMELPSGRVMFNTKKTELLGRDAKDFTHYKDFMNIVHPDDYKVTMDAMRNHLEKKVDTYNCEYRIQNIKGEYLWFHDIGKVVYKSNEKTIIAGVIIEITQKKHAEEKLREAIKKAEKANMYKNQFLANISHEMRSPMNGLVGFASLLKEDNIDYETKKTYIEIIRTTSNQLLNLINDIIDISKIEVGELKVCMEKCHLGSLFINLETTFNELKRQKEKDGIKIKAHIPGKYKDLIIKTDQERLNQVLINIIGNALKFTEKGSIEFGYNIEKDKVVIKVSDTGIGMPKDKFQFIFNRFARLEHNNNAKYDGTGLGLAISKGIVNLLGGTISAYSEEGKGSVFTVELPYVSVDEDGESSVLNTGNELDLEIFREKQILIAEDDRINKFYLKEIFKDIPFKLFWAKDGFEAIEAVEKNPSLSLILMDIRMPKLDGFGAAKEILKMAPNSKIIAQTAYAMADERERIINNGFVDYIAKPLQKEKLLRVIARWIKV